MSPCVHILRVVFLAILRKALPPTWVLRCLQALAAFLSYWQWWREYTQSPLVAQSQLPHHQIKSIRGTPRVSCHRHRLRHNPTDKSTPCCRTWEPGTESHSIMTLPKPLQGSALPLVPTRQSFRKYWQSTYVTPWARPALPHNVATGQAWLLNTWKVAVSIKYTWDF